MAGDEKKSKDPWHKGNIDDTLKHRQNHKRDLVNVIKAMDSQFKTEVTEVLKKHTKSGLPNWSLIDSEHKDYNQKVADEVKAKIDAVYSLDSKLHPLAGVIKKADLEKNYFNNQLIQGLYFKHSDTLKRTIGQKDYMSVMENLHNDNLKHVNKAVDDQILGGLDPDKHGKGVVEYIGDKYKFDKDKVSAERMENDAGDLLANHINKQLSKDSIHRTYKAHKPPKKK